MLADLVAARLAAIVTISAWRAERYPENVDYIQAWDAGSLALLQLFTDACERAPRVESLGEHVGQSCPLRRPVEAAAQRRCDRDRRADHRRGGDDAE